MFTCQICEAKFEVLNDDPSLSVCTCPYCGSSLFDTDDDIEDMFNFDEDGLDV